MQIEFTVQTWLEGDQFIAHAMPLDVASAGPTPATARAALDEAVRLFLRTAEEQGTLTEVLEEARLLEQVRGAVQAGRVGSSTGDAHLGWGEV
jgi:predicted RNase H-like HicB family nuclease